MLNRINRSRINKIKELDYRQKEVLNKFKSYYKENESNDKKFSNTIKKELEELIYSTKDIHSIGYIDDNKWKFLSNIPNNLIEESNEKMYIDIINIISEKLDESPENYIISDSIASEYSIIRVLDNIKEIKEKICQDNINKLIDNIRYSECEEKVKASLLIFELFEKLEDDKLIHNLVSIISASHNSELKSRLIYKILNDCKYGSINDQTREIIRVFINYIDNVKQTKNYANLEILGENLFGYHNNKTLENCDILYIRKLLKLVTDDYPNTDILLQLSGHSEFLLVENRDIFIDIIDTVLNLQIIDKDIRILIVKVILDIVATCNNYNISHYYLTKIKDVKSKKTLEMLLAIYPFMKKYCKSTDNKIFNQICDIDNLGDMILDDNTKRKKLVIPIIYDEEDKK